MVPGKNTQNFSSNLNFTNTTTASYISNKLTPKFYYIIFLVVLFFILIVASHGFIYNTFKKKKNVAKQKNNVSIINSLQSTSIFYNENYLSQLKLIPIKPPKVNQTENQKTSQTKSYCFFLNIQN
jgi:hypothetical protein